MPAARALGKDENHISQRVWRCEHVASARNLSPGLSPKRGEELCIGKISKVQRSGFLSKGLRLSIFHAE